MKQIVNIQTALMPLYYKDFHCIMGDCRQNCCDDGWKIEFSKKDYLRVKRAPKSPELEQLMNQSVSRLRKNEHDRMYAEIRLSESGRCAFHTQEGLCALQMECGAEVLPSICKKFPRGKHHTIAAMEYALSPACESVLALLWDLRNGIDFWEEPLPEKDWGHCVVTNPILLRFADVRTVCIDVLQERSLSLPYRLLLLGLLLQQLRDMDWADDKTVDSWLTRAHMLLQSSDVVAGELGCLPRNQELYLNHNFERIISLHRNGNAELTGELLSALTDFQNIGVASKPVFNGPRYQNLGMQLDELLGHSDYFFENLMVTIAFYQGFPFLGTPKALWDSYLELCDLYSCYRFAAVCSCGKEVSRSRLFYVLVHISRSYLHNQTHREKFKKERCEAGRDTLAHMAILVNG